MRKFMYLGVLSFFIMTMAHAVPEQQATVTAPATATATTIRSAKVDVVVNINSADATELQKVKYIGLKKAQAIVAYRTANGKFNSLDDLLKIKVRGVNQKWLDKVKTHLAI